MWKCVFNTATNRGVDVNRDPQAGEYIVEIPSATCALFAVRPSRYQWLNNQLIEYAGWGVEEALSILNQQQALMVDAIKEKEAQKNAKKIEHPQIVGKVFEPSDRIAKIVWRCDELMNSDPLPTNNGCFDDVDDEPIPMTVGQLKELRNAIIDREELNVLNRKAHIKAMKLVSNPLEYSYSGGWA